MTDQMTATTLADPPAYCSEQRDLLRSIKERTVYVQTLEECTL